MLQTGTKSVSIGGCAMSTWKPAFPSGRVGAAAAGSASRSDADRPKGSIARRRCTTRHRYDQRRRTSITFYKSNAPSSRCSIHIAWYWSRSTCSKCRLASCSVGFADGVYGIRSRYSRKRADGLRTDLARRDRVAITSDSESRHGGSDDRVRRNLSCVCNAAIPVIGSGTGWGGTRPTPAIRCRCGNFS